MKYAEEIVIDRPLDEVIERFDSFENMKQWMEGFDSYEPISGTPGQPGAKTRLNFKMGKRDMEMVETILVRDLPREFSGTYEAPGVFNIVSNRFEVVSPDRTRFINGQEFQFKGFMKIMGALMPGMFRKQSRKYLVAFKSFVESQPRA